MFQLYLGDCKALSTQGDFNYIYVRCTLEGKRERKGYKELLDDPQLRYSGAYER